MIVEFKYVQKQNPEGVALSLADTQLNTLYFENKVQNAIKVPYRYVVQVSDTTMLTRAASLPGQQNYAAEI